MSASSPFIRPDQTILEAIKLIDECGEQIAVVLDENQRLLGTVTDGDVRRGFLKGLTLEALVSEVMEENCITASLQDTKAEILKVMQDKMIKQIPVIDQERKVIRIDVIDELLRAQRRDNQVILMAGGLGQRLKPLTDDCPKPLLKVGKKPILEWILESFRDQGFYRFHLSVNYKAEMVEDYFGDGSKWNVDIDYIRENQKMGTAGALGLLKEKPEKPFFVMNGDLLTNVNFVNLLDYHLENQAMATMCVRRHNVQIPYGVVEIEDHQIQEIKEKPVHSYFVNSGIYALNPEVLAAIPQNQYYDMTELFDKLRLEKKKVCPFPLREYWLDIGKADDFKLAQREIEKIQK